MKKIIFTVLMSILIYSGLSNSLFAGEGHPYQSTELAGGEVHPDPLSAEQTS
jgi:hypothetical protein